MKTPAELRLLGLLFILLPLHVFAQRQYLAATITTNDGQKVEGKVAVVNWQKSPSTIEFTASNGNEKKYAIVDLSEFMVVRNDGGKLFYERKKVDIEVSSHILSELEITPELHYKQEIAWLQLIYQGEWKLYAYTSATGKQHFFIETDGNNPKELVRKQWKNEFKIESVDLYRKQLIDMTQDCPTAQKMLLAGGWGPKPGEGLREKDLVSFCKTIDKCRGDETGYLLAPEKSKMTGQVLAGLHFSRYNFRPVSYKEIKGVSGFQIGFGVTYFLKKSNERSAFYNEVIFFKS